LFFFLRELTEARLLDGWVG